MEFGSGNENWNNFRRCNKLHQITSKCALSLSIKSCESFSNIKNRHVDYWAVYVSLNEIIPRCVLLKSAGD